MILYSRSFCGRHKDITDSPFQKVKVESIDYDPDHGYTGTERGEKCKFFSCANCGAELIYGSLQISGYCPFCGSTSITSDDETNGIMAPQGLISFTVDEKKARQRFSEFMGKRKFLPRIARELTLEKLKKFHFNSTLLCQRQVFLIKLQLQMLNASEMRRTT